MTNYNRLLILITFLFIDLSIGFAQKTWKSDKYAYTVEIPSGYLIRKPTGKNIDLSLQSEDHAIASNINVVVRDISLETDDYDFSIWDTDLKSMFYEMEVGGRQYGLDTSNPQLSSSASFLRLNVLSSLN